MSLIAAAVVAALAATAPATNVLMIAVDDLRPDISGLYSQDFVLSPNLRRLQNRGTTFQRAYCQVALCSPSRTSLLTGRRPDTSHVYTIGPYFRDTMPNGTGAAVDTLPQWTRKQGLWTSGAGKIFHPGTSSGGPGKEGGGDGGYPFVANGSWSEPYFFCDQFFNGTFQSPVAQDFPGDKAGCVQSAECLACLAKEGVLGGQFAMRIADCPASCFPDGAVADEIISRMHAGIQQPFFLAAGFKRPHLGWFVPTDYYNQYRTEDVVVAQHQSPPEISDTSFGGNVEICSMQDVNCTTDPQGNQVVPSDMHQMLRRGYYSAVSFMDSQVGRVLDALDASGLAENTAVVFWGDHGYLLGEHGLWCKTSNFELAARVPLIVALPHHPEATKGTLSRGLTELLDVYPTIVDLLGLPHPEGLQGKSLLPVLQGEVPAVSNASFSQIQRGEVMGISMRTERWRVTEWTAFDYDAGRPVYNASNTDVELYDHEGDDESDFDSFENTNLAKVAAYKDTTQAMRAALWEHWQN